MNMKKLESNKTLKTAAASSCFMDSIGLEIEGATTRVGEIVRDDITPYWAGIKSGVQPAIVPEEIPGIVLATIAGESVWSMSEPELLIHAQLFCKDRVRRNKYSRIQVWQANSVGDESRARYELMCQGTAMIESLILYLALLTVGDVNHPAIRLSRVKDWFESEEWRSLYSQAIRKLRYVKGLHELGGNSLREKTGTMTLHTYSGGLHEIIARSDESGYVCREYARDYELEDKLRHMTSVLVGKMEPVTHVGVV